MRDKTRNVIRRAQEQYLIGPTDDLDEFRQFHDSNLVERGKESYYSGNNPPRVCRETLACRRSKLLAARDRNSNLAAVIFCVHDTRSTYYLVSSRIQSAGNGAITALLWNAIQKSSQRGLTFDFGGVSGHTQGSTLFFTGFGGLVRPRFTAQRYSLGFQLYDYTIAKIFSKLNRFKSSLKSRK